MNRLLLTLAVIVFLYGQANASEVVIGVVREEDEKSRLMVLLDSYDCLVSLSSEKATEIRELTVFQGAKIIVDASALTLVVVTHAKLAEPNLESLKRALLDYMGQQLLRANAAELDSLLAPLRARLEVLKRAEAAEADPTRRAILRKLIGASLPQLDPPQKPFPLEIRAIKI